MTPAEWTALAERCEKATGPDRELDAAIWLVTEPGATRKQWSYVHKATGRTCEIDETRDGTRRLVIVPAFTASLDAIVALVERELPGWTWCTQNADHVFNVRPEAFLLAPDVEGESYPLDDRETYSGEAATPVLALCAAFCRAMAAKETDR